MKKNVIINIVLGIVLLWSMSCNSTSTTDNEKLQLDNNNIIEEIIKSEKEQVLNQANKIVKAKPVTLTDTFCIRSAGNIHDYYSEGTYWWPNPEDVNGKYIRKDGMKNPENFVSHEKALIKFSWSVGTLTSAYLLTGEKEYAELANKYLTAWFIDSTTLMNPNFLYAQAIKGRCTGRGIGLIDATHLIEVAKSVAILEKFDLINKTDLSKIKNWFKDFLQWLYTHPYGITELNWKNNHGTWCNAQAAAYAQLIGDNSIIDSCRRRYKTILLPNQMADNGSLPLELERTRPYAYSLFSIDGMATLVYLISDSTNNFWDFSVSDQRNIKKGIDFIFPFVEDKNKWTLPKDISHWEDLPGKRPFLFFAALAFKDTKYIDVWKSIDNSISTDESRRTEPIKNPILWLNLKEPLK